MQIFDMFFQHDLLSIKKSIKFAFSRPGLLRHIIGDSLSGPVFIIFNQSFVAGFHGHAGRPVFDGAFETEAFGRFKNPLVNLSGRKRAPIRIIQTIRESGERHRLVDTVDKVVDPLRQNI